MSYADLQNFAVLLAQPAMQQNNTLQTNLYSCSKGDDSTCSSILKDPEACCLRLDLRNIPDDPNQAEANALIVLSSTGYPIYEGLVEHKCMYSSVWQSLASL
mmetsp:Transcript_9686/g.14745  ORF Transcript_9686/g.14745 Transcript_9686/m.14745 type:complete len:102 (+) Transcript_9686:15-320(+)